MALFSNKTLMDELWMHAKDILSLKTHQAYQEEIGRLIVDFNPMGFVEKLKAVVLDIPA